VDLGPDPVVLGRAPGSCDVVLVDTGVSRRHAQIERTPTGHRLVDLESSNGTFVNDRRVTAQELEVFDELRVGDHVITYLDARAMAAHPMLDAMTPREGDSSPLVERLVALGVYLHDEAAVAPDGMTAVREVVGELAALTGHARAAIIIESPSGALEAIHTQGLDAGPLDLQALHGVVLATLTGKAVRVQPTPLDRAGEPLTLCLPLDSRPAGARARRTWDVRGALLLAGRARAWSASPEEQRLLGAVARQLALLVSSHWLERQATLDPLTELPNRGSVERALIDAVDRARTTGGSIGLVMLDVDDFKRVNDTHGHGVGDEVLRHVASLLRSTVRGADLAGRWGGEEFIVVLPGEGLEGARAVAEKLVRLVAASPAPGRGIRVTLSAGVAAAPPQPACAVTLVSRADVALYAAKRGGKNRVHLASEHATDLAGSLLAATTELTVGTERLRPEIEGWWTCGVLAPLPLRVGTFIVGRDPDCALVLHDVGVSRRHARLTVSEDGRITFEDTSRYGSLKNGAPAIGPVPLQSGDVVTIGPYQFVLRREVADPRVTDTSTVDRV
jgi:diguanylate cyclase (GGDEF)-like protein